MPKNSKGGSIRIPNLTPAQVRPGVSQQTGIGGGVPAPEPLILHLDQLRIDVVLNLSEGDPVILQIDDLPIVATTLLGQVIGQVRLDDVEEVRARGADTILVAPRGDERARALANELFEVPSTKPLLTPILDTIPLQFLAYFVAKERGLSPDKPRNLAKSVTVE